MNGAIQRMFSLRGRTALVTGARTGIGRAIANALAGAGADLVLLGRGDMTEVEAEIREHGARVRSLAVDLSDVDGAQREVGALLAEQEIDILVNNAGTIHRQAAADVPPADWRRVLSVNLDAVFALCQLTGRQMIARGSGKIINIASLLSFQGGILVPAYTASKHAVAGLTSALANEWAGHGVQVNAIAPGYISTSNTAALRADPVREPAIRARIPAGRWGDPEDLAGAAVFLASPAADYVNGHVLVVDGGWMGR